MSGQDAEEVTTVMSTHSLRAIYWSSARLANRIWHLERCEKEYGRRDSKSVFASMLVHKEIMNIHKLTRGIFT